MSIKLNLVGQKFGRLTVIKEYENSPPKRIFWECQCDCGGNAIVYGSKLKNGHTKSCGCLVSEGIIKRSTKHGFAKRTGVSEEYRVWRNIIIRCHHPSSKVYSQYGAVGISVCERWRYSFKSFIDDMGRRPSKKHSIDRFPNQSGNYEPSNCRWATRNEQDRNKKNNVWIEFNGECHIISDWAKILNVSRTVIRNNGIESIINGNYRKRKTLK